MDTLYRIVFSGQLAPGKRAQDVIPALAAKFKMRQENARAILLKGADQTLKQNLSADKARRYDKALTTLGLVVRIEAQVDEEDEGDFGQASVLRAYPLESDIPKPAAPPVNQGAGTGRHCPKCGADDVSALTGVCQNCGVVVERYMTNHGLVGDTPAAAPSDNPYAPPKVDVTPPRHHTGAGASELHEPESVPIGRGWGWIADGWGLFKAQPFTWIGALVVFYLIIMVLSLIPFVGTLATTLLGPMLSAGLMMGAHAQAQGERFEIGHLFAGISTRAGPLALIGVAYLGFGILIVAILMGLFAVMAPSMMSSMDMNAMQPDTMEGMNQFMTSPAFLLPMLIGLALGLPLAMAMVFAPALVAIDEVGVLRAFKLSFMGCLKNILPFLLYGVVAFVLLILALIPIGLGLLVMLPLLMIALYVAYRDIYHA